MYKKYLKENWHDQENSEYNILKLPSSLLWKEFWRATLVRLDSFFNFFKYFTISIHLTLSVYLCLLSSLMKSIFFSFILEKILCKNCKQLLMTSINECRRNTYKCSCVIVKNLIKIFQFNWLILNHFFSFYNILKKIFCRTNNHWITEEFLHLA